MALRASTLPPFSAFFMGQVFQKHILDHRPAPGACNAPGPSLRPGKPLSSPQLSLHGCPHVAPAYLSCLLWDRSPHPLPLLAPGPLYFASHQVYSCLSVIELLSPLLQMLLPSDVVTQGCWKMPSFGFLMAFHTTAILVYWFACSSPALPSSAPQKGPTLSKHTLNP